jgi:hypothetical protein
MPIESVLSGHSRELPPVGYWTSPKSAYTSRTADSSSFVRRPLSSAQLRYLVGASFVSSRDVSRICVHSPKPPLRCRRPASAVHDVARPRDSAVYDALKKA